MRSIHKFRLVIDDHFTVRMPEGAEIISVQVQRGEPVLWALVETAAPNETRAFACRGTGHDAEGLNRGQHIGSTQFNDGALVFHFFDLGVA